MSAPFIVDNLALSTVGRGLGGGSAGEAGLNGRDDSKTSTPRYERQW
jgi:hypothetical protein